jgi:uncharacterized protein (TIGR02679 family)
MTGNNTRLRETLGRPELQRLVQRLRTRLERGKDLRGILALPNATSAERDALDRLIGRAPTRGTSVAISLDRLDEKLRAAGVCPNLRDAVENLTGAVKDRRAEREATESQWAAIFAAASEQVAGRLELDNWVAYLRANGLLRRYGIAAAQTLVSQALKVLSALPAQDITLAEFAAKTVGDAHALDPDSSLGALVLRAVAALGKCEKWDDAQSRREAWASVGVICDELSAPVLVLNLRASNNQPTSRALRFYADAGEPTFLSIRQLLRTPPAFSCEVGGPVVYVCENPNVVAAVANRLGRQSPPLVCIEGQPRTATRLLLSRLQTVGIRLAYHGDFDWAGIQIANTVISRHNAEPWRMNAPDYRAAAIHSLALSGLPVAATWDSELMPAMQELGRAVHEEQVIEILIGDLAHTPQAKEMNSEFE